MLELIITFIGRIFNFIFGNLGDKLSDFNSKRSLSKEQMNVTKTNIMSTLNTSINSATLVNYFRNRVVGEYLKILGSLASYKYDKKLKTYNVYFVRNKSKIVSEYIRFYKNNIEDKEANIEYTYINKLLSKTGITTPVGSTGDNILLVHDSISSLIYESISGNKSPLYLCHYITNDFVEVGNPTFVTDTYLVMVKTIKYFIDLYLKGDDKVTSSVNNLCTVAGIHLFMSYFKTINLKFYSNHYKPTETNDIMEGLKLYNANSFSVNKIVSFTYDEQNKVKGSIYFDGKYNILKLFGVEIKLTGKMDNTTIEINKINNLLTNVFLKTADNNLKYNFLFFVISTGCIDIDDVLEMKEEDIIETSKFTNESMDIVYENVNPIVNKVLKEQKFEEDSEGNFYSKEFEEFINIDIKSKKNNSNIEPKEVEPIIVSDCIEIVEDTIITSNSFDNTKSINNTEDVAYTKQEPTNSTKVSVIDNVKSLQKEAYMKDKAIDILSKKPLANWSLEECIYVAKNNISIEGITKDDIKERVEFILRSRKR